MLMHVPATPTCNQDGCGGPKLRNHEQQLQRTAQLVRKYSLSMSAYTACSADRFVALLRVGNISHHPLAEFKDVSEGEIRWERRFLNSAEKMKEGSATELSQPLLFDAAHLQQPSLGQQCIVGGKVSPANLPVGIDVGILQYTNTCQLQRVTRIRALKKEK